MRRGVSPPKCIIRRVLNSTCCGGGQWIALCARIQFKGRNHVAQTCQLLEAFGDMLSVFSLGKEKVGRRRKSEECVGRNQELG